MEQKLKAYLQANNYCSIYNNCKGVDLQYVQFQAPWKVPNPEIKNFLTSTRDRIDFMMQTRIYKDIMVPLITFFYLPTSKKLVSYESGNCLAANPKTGDVKAIACVWNGDNSGQQVDADGFVQSGWVFNSDQLRLGNTNQCVVAKDWGNANQIITTKLTTCSMSDRTKINLRNATDGYIPAQYLQNQSMKTHLDIGNSFPFIPDSVSVFFFYYCIVYKTK